MKKSIVIFSLLLSSISYPSIAQKTKEGVFLSANDFSIGKISYSPQDNGSKYRLHVNTSFYKAPVVVTTGNSVIHLSKDSVFGYRDRRNTCYRFYQKGVYKILNPSEKLILYSTTIVVENPRNTYRVTNYFFSKNANSPLFPLSKLNLKMVFYADNNFVRMLDDFFPGDQDLTAFDKPDKSYLLNKIQDQEQPATSKLILN